MYINTERASSPAPVKAKPAHQALVSSGGHAASPMHPIRTEPAWPPVYIKTEPAWSPAPVKAELAHQALVSSGGHAASPMAPIKTEPAWPPASIITEPVQQATASSRGPAMSPVGPVQADLVRPPVSINIEPAGSSAPEMVADGQEATDNSIVPSAPAITPTPVVVTPAPASTATEKKVARADRAQDGAGVAVQGAVFTLTAADFLEGGPLWPGAIPIRIPREEAVCIQHSVNGGSARPMVGVGVGADRPVRTSAVRALLASGAVTGPSDAAMGSSSEDVFPDHMDDLAVPGGSSSG